MDIKSTFGEVQAIRTDRTSLEINGVWYNSKFNLIPVDINKGDQVIISFTENKGFNNIKKIEKAKPVNYPLEVIKSIPKPFQPIGFKEDKDKTSVMILSYAKDIVVSLIENKEQIYADLDSVLNHITDTLVKNYKKIKENI